MSTNNPPMSRKARKDLANSYMKFHGDTREKAIWHVGLINKYQSKMWHKRIQKNPRRRSDYVVNVHIRFGPLKQHIRELVICCGKDRKPLFIRDIGFYSNRAE